MVGTISGNQVILTPVLISELFDLVNRDDSLDQDCSEYRTMLARMGHPDEVPAKLLKKNLSVQYKFLADIVGKVLLGKHSTHDNINRQQFAIMSSLVNGKSVNWADLFFELIRRKSSKKEVCFGRILGIFLLEKAPKLMVSQTQFINASKKMVSSLFGKSDRTIPRPSSASRTSEDSRADAATFPTPENVPLYVSPLVPSVPTSQI
ncbi:hypothetical protein KSP39_PZI000996 [Platanthera zijinensis]|uniref:Uncharacterized protein n=1 Tax=Platanthera zijinensis TaxID=2320716 RepID=A0AAP0C1U9_9ASPA